MRGSQIPKILATGKSLSSPLFNLKYLNRPKEVEVGFIVSKKTAPLAVDRNLIKRRLRHAFKTQTINLPPGQYLFLAKPLIKTTPFKSISQTIHSLIHEIPNS